MTMRHHVASRSCNRRSFLTSAALVPAAALAAAQPDQGHPLPKPATGVRITVIKRTQELELQRKYLKEGVIPACGVVRDGQEFLAGPPYSSCPDGMCRPAWDHMSEGVAFVHGGSVDRLVVCCTDGYRPVFFLLERTV